MKLTKNISLDRLPSRFRCQRCDRADYVSLKERAGHVFRQDQRRSARAYQGAWPSPIAFALTKTWSGRMLQSNQERL
ncbi:hypothetical protein CPT32_25640 [Rhizobium sophoriradicis]|nr:hypothetical protein CPT32_25640 [Rhizobium sophoriradicis]